MSHLYRVLSPTVSRVVVFAAALMISADSAAERVARGQLSGLLADCDKARQSRLEPIRREKIAACQERGKQKSYCEHRYQDYGERGFRIASDNVIGLFWDLPICEKAIAAERYFARNPRAQEFDYQPL